MQIVRKPAREIVNELAIEVNNTLTGVFYIMLVRYFVNISWI